MEENPKLAIGLMIGVIAGCVGLNSLLKSKNEQTRAMIEEMNGTGSS